MNTILFALIISLVTMGVAQNSDSIIDSLNSTKQIEAFIQTNHDNGFIMTTLPVYYANSSNNNHCKNLAEELEITKTHYKGDFDGNGYNDILVFSRSKPVVNVLMDFGSSSVKLIALEPLLLFGCVFPRVIKKGNMSVIEYNYEPFSLRRKNDAATSLERKSLIYKFGGWIEYNKLSTQYPITKLEFQGYSCFGSCPEFHLSIENNGNARYRAINNNINPINKEQMLGTYRAHINDSDISEIFNLLNYLDFPNLQIANYYFITDMPGVRVKILYNSEEKELYDYGLSSFFGLNLLYSKLSQLRFNQQWEKLSDSPYY